MSRKWFSILALIAAATFLFNLVQLWIQSASGFDSGGSTGRDIQLRRSEHRIFKAIGTYEHPPADQGHYQYRDVVGRIPRTWSRSPTRVW